MALQPLGGRQRGVSMLKKGEVWKGKLPELMGTWELGRRKERRRPSQAMREGGGHGCTAVGSHGGPRGGLAGGRSQRGREVGGMEANLRQCRRMPLFFSFCFLCWVFQLG